jgi:hypothetical protein
MRREFHCEVETNSPVETAFAVYTDTNFWQGRSIFGEIRWIRGRPWQVGSRIESHFTSPAYGQIEQTVASYELNRRIVLLSRLFGMTLESRIDFTATPQGSQVSVTTQANGSTTFVFGMAVDAAFQRMTSAFLATLREEANSRATAA